MEIDDNDKGMIRTTSAQKRRTQGRAAMPGESPLSMKEKYNKNKIQKHKHTNMKQHNVATALVIATYQNGRRLYPEQLVRKKNKKVYSVDHDKY